MTCSRFSTSLHILVSTRFNRFLFSFCTDNWFSVLLVLSVILLFSLFSVVFVAFFHSSLYLRSNVENVDGFSFLLNECILVISCTTFYVNNMQNVTRFSSDRFINHDSNYVHSSEKHFNVRVYSAKKKQSARVGKHIERKRFSMQFYSWFFYCLILLEFRSRKTINDVCFLWQMFDSILMFRTRWSLNFSHSHFDSHWCDNKKLRPKKQRRTKRAIQRKRRK